MSALARPGAALAVAAIALLAAGCGSTVIDRQKVEEQVKASSEKISGNKVSAVECPSGVDVEPGATFTCSVEFSSGKEATAKLKIRNEEADLNFEDLSPAK
jgi:NAD(P)H-hydrate repair Nnr-like enzyme with NAD(P)H-hydrate epimerase domain